MPPKKRVVKAARGARKTPPSKTAAARTTEAASPETAPSPAVEVASPGTTPAPAAETASPGTAPVAELEAAADTTTAPAAAVEELPPPGSSPQDAPSDAAPPSLAPEATCDAGAAAEDGAELADAAPGTGVSEAAEAPEGATEGAEAAAKRPGKRITTKVRKVTRRVPVKRARSSAAMQNEEKGGDGEEGQETVPMETTEQEGNPGSAVCAEAPTENEEKGGDGEESREIGQTPMGATEQEGNPSSAVCSEAAVSISAQQIKPASDPGQPSAADSATSNVEALPAVESKKRVRKVKIVKRVVKKVEASQKDEKMEEAEVGTIAEKLNNLDSDVKLDESSKTNDPAAEVEASTVSNGAPQMLMQEDGIPESDKHCSRSDAAGETVVADQEKVEDGSAGDVLEGATERQKRRKTEIFIGGLDRGAKEDDIRKVFAKAGEIVEIRLMMDAKTGKNKGYAFLRYATAGQAKQAVSEFAKVEVCGKQCGAAALEGNDTIFLGNIDKKWRKDDLIELLNEIGIEKIDTLTIMPDPKNADCNRGFAFLELETNRDAQIAFKKLQKKDAFGKGRNVKVAWAEPLNDPDEEEMQKVKSVYAEGIPSSWDEKNLREYFMKFGEIERVALSRNMQSAKRKDFAFVNFTTREAALSCIEAFDKDDLTDENSKVNLRVSLAKPVPKGKQNKTGSKSANKDSSNEKPKAVQRETKVAVSNKSQSFKGTHGAVGGNGTSTTRELLHVLREQASWKQGQPGYPIGAPTPGHRLVSHEGKRPLSALGDDVYSDPRGYSRARLDSAYQAATTSYSTLPHSLSGASSLAHYQQQTLRYGTGSVYGATDASRYGATDASRTFQMRPGSASRGGSLYSR